MKNMKKILALLVAMMIIAASFGALAADETPTTYSITISKDSTDKAAHTYGAYQLFKGDLSEEDGTKTLSNIQWGDSIDSNKVATLIADINTALGLTGEAALANDASAATVAKAIGDKSLTKDSDGAKALAEAFNKALTTTAKGTASIAADATSGKIEGLPAGYYLVKDDAKVTAEGAVTRYMMEVVSNVTVTEKGSVSKVEKKVKDEAGNAQDAADYDIGDKVPYTITGTLPSNFEDYKTFKTFTFTDTMSNGLTPPAVGDVKVYLNTEKTGTDITSLFDIAIDGQVLTVSLKSGTDLRAVTDPTFANGDKLIVSYEATLNENAKIGSQGNENTVKLEFSNNPNSDGDGDKGTTPDDKTVVFTYEIKALKVEPTSDAAIDQEAYNALTDAEKANYVKIGDKYHKTQALEGAGFTLYKKNDGAWEQVGNEITGVTTFEFKGTDAGEYKLVETTVPAGYNKAEDVQFTIEATYDTTADDPKLKSLTVTPATAGFTVSTATIENDDTHITTDGVVTGKIVNQKGSTLPSTGGIGTTIFYVAGSILVLAAVVLLVTKRRMSADE